MTICFEIREAIVNYVLSGKSIAETVRFYKAANIHVSEKSVRGWIKLRKCTGTVNPSRKRLINAATLIVDVPHVEYVLEQLKVLAALINSAILIRS